MGALEGSKPAQLFAARFAEASQGIDRMVLDHVPGVAERLVWREIRLDDESRNFVCLFDDLERGLDAHPADHGVESHQV